MQPEDTRINLALILKGQYNDLQGLKHDLEKYPGIRLVYSTFSGRKLFVSTDKGVGENE